MINNQVFMFHIIVIVPKVSVKMPTKKVIMPTKPVVIPNRPVIMPKNQSKCITTSHYAYITVIMPNNNS